MFFSNRFFAGEWIRAACNLHKTIRIDKNATRILHILVLPILLHKKVCR